jgi:AraC-like DNA-binding protein
MLQVNQGNNIGQSLTGLDAPYGDFNFFMRPPGWIIARHRHHFFQFLLVLSGELLLFAGEDEAPAVLTRGMASLIPPGTSHLLRTETGYAQFGINTVPDGKDEGLIRILSTHITSPVILTMSVLLDIIPEVEDCTRLQTMISIQKIRNRLEYMLLSCADALKKQDGVQAFREKIMNYFRENISEPLTLGDVSKTLVLSPTHVERLSYQEFGCGAIHLFQRLKIDRARTLLHTTDLSVYEISKHLGYDDQSYFSRLFKKHSGVSPRDYKKARSLGSCPPGARFTAPRWR